VIVPPGGSTVAEVGLEVPGKFILVDHSLSRMQRGLMAWLVVDGAPRPDLYNGVVTPGSGQQAGAAGGAAWLPLPRVSIPPGSGR
jgi:hypothetical protein